MKETAGWHGRKAVIGAGCVLALISLCSCRNESKSTSPVVVRVGYLPLTSSLPLYIAQDNGFFDAAKVQIKGETFKTSPLMGSAFVSDSADIVVSLATTVALAQESRDPGRFRVLLLDAYTPDHPLTSFVSGAASHIDRIEDLKGRRLGIFPGPSTKLFFGLILQHHGVGGPTDVQVTEIDPGSETSALAAGQVDALATLEPFATGAAVEANGRMFVTGAVEGEIISPYNGGAWLISRKFIQAHPDAVKPLVSGFEKAVDFLRSNPAQARASLSKHTSLSAAVIERVPMPAFAKTHEVDRATFHKYVELVRTGKIISQPIDENAIFLDDNR
jgi:ABC-type nitrate/sulfonate/bicarbonate transport system substrate-binding protein